MDMQADLSIILLHIRRYIFSFCGSDEFDIGRNSTRELSRFPALSYQSNLGRVKGAIYT